MNTRLSIAVAMVTAIIPLAAKVALADKPSPYLALEAPQRSIYLQVGNLYPRSWGQPDLNDFRYQPLGRTYPQGRSPMVRSGTVRSGTVIVAPEAETIIIYQDGNSGRQRPRIITHDGDDWDNRAFDHHRPFPSRPPVIYHQSIADQYFPPYPYTSPYTSWSRRPLISCYPASWHNFPLSRVAVRQSCY
ncbi:hypothetical protein [Trichothermofontia sp.]